MMDGETFTAPEKVSYQIRLNNHRMVKLGVLRSQESGVRRRKNYKDERSYDD
ncbi:MAG: hypothetical protein F6K08_33530 [Okeania sp. SIO1H6]|uniref:hypothetical protein n=2 Tax=Okeania TaxID=1458928 RepID=UPI001374C096|nr:MULTISPECIES: hypothetical protein [Okeania]NES91713.1 hypothetical protein [Okeania sp. SIO2B9]NET17392.1 hypothetical protein [Okeania sp. SIO1H6]NET20055.1 hypothetical protein [Okeania sp. SIO1H5]